MISTKFTKALLGATALTLVAFGAHAAAKKPAPVAPAADPRDVQIEMLKNELKALSGKVEALEGGQQDAILKAKGAEGMAKNAASLATATKVEYAGSPRFSDAKGTYKFKIRGRVQADYWNVIDSPSGRDYPSGGYLRRARLGAEGTLGKDWDYKFEADFGRNNNPAGLTTTTSVVTGVTPVLANPALPASAANPVIGFTPTTSNITSNNNSNTNSMLTDVYLRYSGAKPWYFTVGKQYLPFGFEQQTSDNYITFIERAVTSDIGSAGTGGDRRVGVTALYAENGITGKVGLFSEDDALNAVRADKNWTAAARFTYAPILEKTKWVHLGAATYYTKVLGGLSYASNGAPNATPTNTIRLRSRAVQVADDRVVDTGNITNVDNLWGVGGELAGVYGPWSLQGELNYLKVNRLATTASNLGDPSFVAFYVEGTYNLTGESRAYDKEEGVAARLKPAKDFGADGWGLWQLGARYEQVDYEKCGVVATGTCAATLSPATGTGVGGKLQNYTFGINWIPTAYVKFMLNYVHSEISNGLDLYRLTGTTATVHDYSLDSVGIRGQLDW